MVFDDCPAEPLSALCTRPTGKPRRISLTSRKTVPASLASVHFDLVIVDEAHKMAAHRYGNKLDKTGRYRLGEVLSQSATHLLFLTATPHHGDPENFRLFLDLLEPGFFATPEMPTGCATSRKVRGTFSSSSTSL